MTTFPALVPSSRTFTPGEYPATAFSGYSGFQNRVRHSNVFLTAQLRLTFLGLTQAQMLDIWNHYNGRRGEFRSFALPAEIVSYGGITDYVPGTYLWRYAGSGSVEDLPCGGHNVSLTLETVPPIAASVIGAQLFIVARLSVGVANGGEYEPGISESLTFSIQTGAAFAALNGISESLALDLEPGAAAGDVEVEGVSLFVFMYLLDGAGANQGRNGIDETINLSLATGAADDGNAAVDPDFANVSLLLHMDGSNGSTTFTDSSSNALTVTANGNAQISTAQSKFDGASGLFDGNGDYLTTPYSTSLFNWWTDDYTIEAWVYASSWTSWSRSSQGPIPCMIGHVSATAITAFWSFGPQSDGKLKFYYFNGSEQHAMVTASTVPTGQWAHVAAVKTSSGVTLYIDGVSSGGTFAVNGTPQSGAVPLTIGQYFATSINGYIDDLRITKGVARYTANFTPPTAAFPNS